MKKQSLLYSLITSIALLSLSACSTLPADTPSRIAYEAANNYQQEKNEDVRGERTAGKEYKEFDTYQTKRTAAQRHFTKEDQRQRAHDAEVDRMVKEYEEALEKKKQDDYEDDSAPSSP